VGRVEKMTFVNNDTKIREIRQGDYDFYITDGTKLSPRAYIEVSEVCPTNIKLAIHRAMADGYLKAVACVKEKDYMWEKLSG
jgi:hypothetical protein